MTVAEAINYIESVEFNSFREFVEIASKDNKLKSIQNALGELHTYYVTCEKIGIPIDPQITEALNN